ncbi:HAD family hydrolase [Caldalkalibacillus uzonensis]|nr:HAD hydrolase-like protein [Caldalkalibacillus uzonensis]
MQLGIMFDMDNTLLQSRINFKAMREEIVSFLLENKIGTRAIYEREITPAQVIERGKSLVENPDEKDRLTQEIFNIVTKHETLGMKNVQLEQGVKQGLAKLKKKKIILTVVTNNAYASASLALEGTGILPYMDTVIGRDQMEVLKPAPSGLLVVKQRFPEVKSWVMLGDSWIDGKAAQSAGIDFVAYKGDEERMREQGVIPATYVNHFRQFVTWVEAWAEKRVVT